MLGVSWQLVQRPMKVVGRPSAGLSFRPRTLVMLSGSLLKSSSPAATSALAASSSPAGAAVSQAWYSDMALALNGKPNGSAPSETVISGEAGRGARATRPPGAPARTRRTAPAPAGLGRE